ncbi:MAG: S8 family serine peptidase [Candidatus Heimdallarchaeota archaeon]|nr:S8 family serine peptidase [Candidatus Heimdallarchaeota archaeon]
MSFTKIKSPFWVGFIVVLTLLIPPQVIRGTTSEIYWNLQDVGIPEAWEFTNGSSDIVVAIIDSGVDLSHPDLVNSSWINPGEIPSNGWDDDQNGYIDDIVGWDFCGDNLIEDNNPFPPPSTPASKHGTFIAGLIVGDNDNDISVGVAPNIKIMSLRFLRSDLSFFASDWPNLVAAIDYAVDNGAKIINLSIQAYGIPPNYVYEAIQRAYAAGVILVSVTGNNEDHVTYPGNYSEVIAVSATTSTREIADFSSPGDQNEICAPGEDVYSITGYLSSIVSGSDSSYATPLVSGAIALLLSLNSSLSNDEVRNFLHESCIDLGEVGKDPIFGYGLLNIPILLSKITTINTTSSITSSVMVRTDLNIPALVFSYMILTILAILTFLRDIRKRRKK